MPPTAHDGSHRDSVAGALRRQCEACEGDDVSVGIINSAPNLLPTGRPRNRPRRNQWLNQIRETSKAGIETCRATRTRAVRRNLADSKAARNVSRATASETATGIKAGRKATTRRRATTRHRVATNATGIRRRVDRIKAVRAGRADRVARIAERAAGGPAVRLALQSELLRRSTQIDELRLYQARATRGVVFNTNQLRTACSAAVVAGHHHCCFRSVRRRLLSVGNGATVMVCVDSSRTSSKRQTWQR